MFQGKKGEETRGAEYLLHDKERNRGIRLKGQENLAHTLVSCHKRDAWNVLSPGMPRQFN
jgi:hypothetical protein